MKKIFLLFIIILSFNITGCENNKKDNKLESIDINKFAEKRNLETLSILSMENTYVFTYKKDNKYGIMEVYIDKSNEVNISDNSLNINDFNKRILHLQLKGRNNKNHVGLFILDENLINKSKDISIEFKEKIKEKPYKIDVTISNKESVIITYKNENLRKIKRIILYSENKNKIYINEI
ncbi:MAG: hypothetical protein FH753_06050 [Firmicutes bacterium]|nr:hypothetical protein [Bacillota bacterium]